MGELILCTSLLAKVPYFWENVSENVYSLEELVYLIKKNVFLVDKTMISEELCTWIEMEIGDKLLADELRQDLKKNNRVSSFVNILLDRVGYLSASENDNIVKLLIDLETKSELEVEKLKADQLLKSDKILRSIKNYYKLLSYTGKRQMDDRFIGNIWHNLGSAYARLFQFNEAIDCFLKAYSLTANLNSLKMSLYAAFCEKNEKKFYEIAEEYDVDTVILSEIKKNVEDFYLNDSSDLVFTEKNSKKKEENVKNLILELKKEYKKLCS
ncbi:tetratricopeptide repeat protein [Lachnobacterium bovis]|uniref:tetratricopeptide repeat protein n=1 Tax=Lachnobacterium bovis TaxID=140626 RepID=UPI0003B41831|nr:tetratricopeptide repeat protein [Lachnobacterium bovis]